MKNSLALAVFTVVGTVLFLLMPGIFWVVGIGLIFAGWISSLFFSIPNKKDHQRGRWTLFASFILLTATASSAILIILQGIATPADQSPEILSRFAALLAGLVGGVILTLLFFTIIGYFSSIYILSFPEEEGISFWNSFRSFVSVVLGIQYRWLVIENGEAEEIKNKKLGVGPFSVGKIVVNPGNAIVLARGGKISGIYGPGVIVTGKEQIRQVFDLRPQFKLHNLSNVMTADQIPLDLELGVGYRITPADSDDPKALKEANYQLFPVREETLVRAAFNGTAGGWMGFGANVPVGQLRDQIMAHKFEELFEIDTRQENLSIRVNERPARQIEQAIMDAANGFADTAMGVTITTVDIRQITLPNGALEADAIKEAIAMGIKSRAEADAIQKIEEERNAARGQLVTAILDSIAARTDKISNDELEWATIFAQISRRALTDDVLGHQYVEMLKAMAEGDATKIFNATPDSSSIEPKRIPMSLPSQPSSNGHHNL